MDIAHAHADAAQVFVQLLGHSLRQRCHQHPLVVLGALAYLFHKVVHLPLHRAHLDGRIQQPGRTHNLFYHKAFRLLEFVVGRSGAHIYHLPRKGLELLELQRTVVGRCGQAEAVLHQHALAGMVAAVHRANLRQRHVTLIDESHEILGEIVQQAEGPLPFLAPVEVAGIVLDAGAIAHLLDHLEVVFHPLLQALGLQSPALRLEPGDLLHQVVLYGTHGSNRALAGSHEVCRRANAHPVDFFYMGARHRINQTQPVNLVAEKLNAYGLVRPTQEHINYIAVHTEGPALEIGLGTAVESIDQLVQQARERAALPFHDLYRLRMEILRIADAVQAADAGNDYNVAPAAHQRRSGRQTEFLNLVVYAEVLLYIGIRNRDVCLGLIIVVVRHEVLHGVVREERLEFPVQLRRKRLVVTENQGRTLQALDYAGHREGLAGTGDAQKGNVRHSFGQCRTELVYGLRLVSGGLVCRLENKLHKVLRRY